MTDKQIEILSKLFKEGKITLKEILDICKNAEKYITTSTQGSTPISYKYVL